MKILITIIALTFSTCGGLSLTVSDDGRHFIKQHEGYARTIDATFVTPYRCPAGVATVGPGLTGSWVIMGRLYTHYEIDGKFREYLKRYEKIVNDLRINLNQCQFDALVSFAFNLGSIRGGLRTALKARQYKLAMFKLKLYVRAGGKRLRGLERRREAEVQLFENCKYE